MQAALDAATVNDTMVYREAQEIAARAQQSVPGLDQATKWLQEHAHECAYEQSPEDKKRQAKASHARARGDKVDEHWLKLDCYGDAQGSAYASAFNEKRGGIDFPPYIGHPVEESAD